MKRVSTGKPTGVQGKVGTGPRGLDTRSLSDVRGWQTLQEFPKVVQPNTLSINGSCEWDVMYQKIS